MVCSLDLVFLWRRCKIIFEIEGIIILCWVIWCFIAKGAPGEPGAPMNKVKSDQSKITKAVTHNSRMESCFQRLRCGLSLAAFMVDYRSFNVDVG